MTFPRSEPFNALPHLPPAAELETKPILRQTIASARALADLRGIAAKIPNQAVRVSDIGKNSTHCGNVSKKSENVDTFSGRVEGIDILRS